MHTSYHLSSARTALVQPNLSLPHSHPGLRSPYGCLGKPGLVCKPSCVLAVRDSKSTHWAILLKASDHRRISFLMHLNDRVCMHIYQSIINSLKQRCLLLHTHACSMHYRGSVLQSDTLPQSQSLL